MVGADLDGEKQTSAHAIIVDPDRRKKAKDSNILISDRLICMLFTAVLLEYEGVLGKCMLNGFVHNYLRWMG